MPTLKLFCGKHRVSASSDGTLLFNTAPKGARRMLNSSPEHVLKIWEYQSIYKYIHKLRNFASLLSCRWRQETYMVTWQLTFIQEITGTVRNRHMDLTLNPVLPYFYHHLYQVVFMQCIQIPAPWDQQVFGISGCPAITRTLPLPARMPL